MIAESLTTLFLHNAEITFIKIGNIATNSGLTNKFRNIHIVRNVPVKKGEFDNWEREIVPFVINFKCKLTSKYINERTIASIISFIQRFHNMNTKNLLEPTTIDPKLVSEIR